MNKMLDFHFYTILLAHNWNPNFGELGGPYSNDNNSLDLHKKNSKFFIQIRAQNILSKTFSLCLRISFHSKVIVEMAT